MNGNKLLDTNILIYLSKNELSPETFANKEDQLHISVITYMEAMGFKFDSDHEESIINSLCSILETIPLSDNIVEEVFKIRKTSKIKLPDAIIAASAKVHNLTLIIHNTTDFKEMKRYVKIVDPFKI